MCVHPALAEVGARIFDTPHRENGISCKERGRLRANFPVLTVSCKLRGFSQTQIEVDATTFTVSQTCEVSCITVYKEMVGNGPPFTPQNLGFTSFNSSSREPSRPITGCSYSSTRTTITLLQIQSVQHVQCTCTPSHTTSSFSSHLFHIVFLVNLSCQNITHLSQDVLCATLLRNNEK
jgi:hypothetical protein